MEKINGWAASAREKFLAGWNMLQDIQKYEKMLDQIPYTVLLDHPKKEQMKACTDLHEKVLLLEEIYLAEYI